LKILTYIPVVKTMNIVTMGIPSMPPIKKKQKSNNNLPQKNDPQKSAEESNNNNIVRNIAKGKPSKTLCINPRVTAGNVTISGGTVYLRELNDKGYITENTVTIFVSSFGIAIFDFLNQLAGELSQPPRRLRIYRKIDDLETVQFSHKWANYGLISEQRGTTLAAMGVKDHSEILLEKQTTLDTWPTQKTPLPNSPKPYRSDHIPFDHDSMDVSDDERMRSGRFGADGYPRYPSAAGMSRGHDGIPMGQHRMMGNEEEYYDMALAEAMERSLKEALPQQEAPILTHEEKIKLAEIQKWKEDQKKDAEIMADKENTSENNNNLSEKKIAENGNNEKIEYVDNTPLKNFNSGGVFHLSNMEDYDDDYFY